MKQSISQPARRRATNDTGYGDIVAPGVTGEATEAITLEEYRAMVQPKRPRNDAEYEMQCALIAWRDALVGQYPVLARLAHWPSGEHRTKQAAARIRKMGGARGLPDLWLFVPHYEECDTIYEYIANAGLCIELKAGNNKLSGEQAEWRELLAECGFKYRIAYDDWTIAARLIAEWCGLPEGVVP